MQFNYILISNIINEFGIPSLPSVNEFEFFNEMYKYKLITGGRLHNIYIFKKNNQFYITKIELEQYLKFYNIDEALIDLVNEEYEKRLEIE